MRPILMAVSNSIKLPLSLLPFQALTSKQLTSTQAAMIPHNLLQKTKTWSVLGVVALIHGPIVLMANG
jgi:hypothetical protein